MGLCEVVITLKGCITLNAVKTQPGLPSELQDRQGYTEKHCFKTTNKHKNGNNKALSNVVPSTHQYYHQKRGGARGVGEHI